MKPPKKAKEEKKSKEEKRPKEEGKKKRRKNSSSDESSEGGYYQEPAKNKPVPVPVEEPVMDNPLSKSSPTNSKKAPPKPEPKRVFVDEDDSDDGLGRWNS